MKIEVKNSQKPVDYLESMKILEQRSIEVFEGKKDELLWILEHNTVYTSGTSSNNTDLLDKKIKLIKTNRGGKITLHSPGQKVIYFVLNLNKREKNVRKLISKIENCVIQILREFHIVSYADPKNIGIWINDKNEKKKIAAIGVRIKKWVAYHGFSININNDLSLYKKIIPCGIKDKKITSLHDLGLQIPDNISDLIIKKTLNIFL